MFPDRMSLAWYIFRGQLVDAERLSPGHGCELLTALATVVDAGLLAGFATGVFVAWVGYDLVGWVLRRREHRHAD